MSIYHLVLLLTSLSTPSATNLYRQWCACATCPHCRRMKPLSNPIVSPKQCIPFSHASIVPRSLRKQFAFDPRTGALSIANSFTEPKIARHVSTAERLVTGMSAILRMVGSSQVLSHVLPPFAEAANGALVVCNVSRSAIASLADAPAAALPDGPALSVASNLSFGSLTSCIQSSDPDVRHPPISVGPMCYSGALYSANR